jgi:hypothetical protein
LSSVATRRLSRPVPGGYFRKEVPAASHTRRGAAIEIAVQPEFRE